jgi:hypothetical protein
LSNFEVSAAFLPDWKALLVFVPSVGTGFSFFQDQFLAEGAGFFARPVLEIFSSTGFDFSSPSPLPNKHNKRYSPPRKSGFWQVFLFPLGGVCHPRAAPSGRQTLPRATKTLPKPTIFSVRNSWSQPLGILAESRCPVPIEQRQQCVTENISQPDTNMVHLPDKV